MRRGYAIAWALLALAALAGVGSARAQEAIQRYDSVVQVAEDGTLTVTETIRVHADGREIRRGIYRDFPLAFRDAGGRLREVTFSLRNVTRDGRPEPHFTKREGHGIRIYAGKQDVLLPRGDYTYVFTYETGRQIRWFDGKPELNWNVTGNFWHFPILTVNYQLKLPGGVRPVRWTAFTGPPGARGTAWRGDIDAGGALGVVTTRPLAAGEGLTVVAEIPRGAVAPPTTATELWYAILDYRNWIIGAGGLALLLIYYLAAWNAIGRDPKHGVIIPLFHPPKNISPALANYIHNWGFSRDKWRAFTAAALSLAVRGLLQFDDRDGSLTLKATGKQPQGGLAALPPGERAIFEWVNSKNGLAMVNRAHGHEVATIGSRFTKSIEGENRNKFFRRNFGYLIAGLALTAMTVAALVFSGAVADTDLFLLFAIGFAGLWFGLFLLRILRSVFTAISEHSLVRTALAIIVLCIVLTLFGRFLGEVLPSDVGGLLLSLTSLLSGHPFPFALIASFAALNGLFLYLMRAPTALGRPVMDQLDGFKLYLETAEADRLNMQAPEITAERFEALLPYAVALNVEKPWSEAFAAAIARAHPDDPDAMSGYRPGWYSGSGGWSTRDFSSSVSAAVASTSAAFASAVPSSSSSGFSGGSGGGSGGGGGGGGGGGW